jgi:hypothetical protein
VHGQVQAVVIESAYNIIYHVPLIDSDETLQEPEAEIVVHLLAKYADFLLLGDFGLELLLISLFVHDRLEHVRVLVLHKLNLPLQERLNLIRVILGLLKVAQMRPYVFEFD